MSTIPDSRLTEIINTIHQKLPITTEIIQIINATTLLLQSESNMVTINSSTAIIGDIHGQLEDLQFCLQNSVNQNNVLQLGDFVDRGPNSLECMLLLYVYKLKFPQNVFILRGNHEIDEVCRKYGFYDEIKRKSSEIVYSSALRSFEALPVACEIRVTDTKFHSIFPTFHSFSTAEPLQKPAQSNGFRLGFAAKTLFCVHGGIAERFKTVSEIVRTPRFSLNFEPMLWPDPTLKHDFYGQSQRGIGLDYGVLAVDEFCKTNDFSYIVRGHQYQENGFSTIFNQVCTIWSAANYCGRMGNTGAMGVFDGEFMRILEFQSQRKKGRPVVQEQIDYFL